jgi:hypothetical protein
MDNIAARGHLRKRPLSFLLYELWGQKSNGRLVLSKRQEEKKLVLEDGEIAFELEDLDEIRFFSVLKDRDVIETSALEKCRQQAEKSQISLIKACTELEIIPPAVLWPFIQDHAQSGLLPLFDWDDADYTYHPDGYPPRGTQVLCLLPTLSLILQGTRQMNNLDLILSQMPDDETPLKALFPRHLSLIQLLPHEEYLLKLISLQPRLKFVYEQSELSQKETHKGIFTFMSLGLFSFPQNPENKKAGDNMTQGELHKILSLFNRRWMCVYKYISKELGPLAPNVLEKSLEESKSRLTPLFHNIRIRNDGRIEADSVLRARVNFSRPEIKQNLLVGLNEILVAAVLAVKKTLGEEHETALVRNLEKIDK